MAKKKPKPAAKKAAKSKGKTPVKSVKSVKLTPTQYEALAKLLFDTTGNVYTLAKAVYNYEFTEADFDVLEVNHGIFRCEECTVWQPIDAKDKQTDMCEECIGEPNG
jgi:hypothetical protein